MIEIKELVVMWSLFFLLVGGVVWIGGNDNKVTGYIPLT